jgi:predicted Fe-Mo cluster-binding NifX family protein
MKIAIASDDKQKVAEHFGAAPYMVVLDIEKGEIKDEEVREKTGHKEHAQEESHPQTGKEGHHGFTVGSTQRHKEIADTIKDCKAVIAGRMGLGAYEDLRDSGFEVITTELKDIKEVATLYAEGKLSHSSERLH